MELMALRAEEKELMEALQDEAKQAADFDHDHAQVRGRERGGRGRGVACGAEVSAAAQRRRSWKRGTDGKA